MTRAYYNEFDPKAAQWIRNLIAAGHLPDGDVDTRSIEDVTPNDLAGYTQCHFFAGLGGWPLALALAGWPAGRPVWTGSCPCQPFSAAGKGAGFADERHLWPAWQHLIAQCRPPVVFGEQVASKAVDPWIDLVHADLEGMGYAFGCVPFPAAGIGAPHIRDRTYWVADTDVCPGDERGSLLRGGGNRGIALTWAGSSGRCVPDWMAHASGERLPRGQESHGKPEQSGQPSPCGRDPGGRGAYGGMGHSERNGLRGSWRAAAGITHQPSDGEIHAAAPCEAGPTNGQWAAADWVLCTDGKWRPVEPGTQPLAHGLPGRVVRLRAYGNAIVPAQAVEFILSYVEGQGLTLGVAA